MTEKNIIVTLDEKTLKPLFQFNGYWTGNEVKRVIGKIRNGYHQYSAARKKELDAKSEEKPEQEVTYESRTVKPGRPRKT